MNYNYCTKCRKSTTYECPLYRREGEDTYDFHLCHKCEVKLWGKFLPETATFNWQEEE